MIESRSTGSHGSAVWFSEHTLIQHYLIAGHGSKGLELPHIFSDSGEEMLPVFSSEEAAQEFLTLSSLGKRWYVRVFSCGELVSVIFAFHRGMKGVLLDPQPGSLSGDVMVSLVGRDAFVSSLLKTRSYHPAVGARLQLSVRAGYPLLASDDLTLGKARVVEGRDVRRGADRGQQPPGDFREFGYYELR